MISDNLSLILAQLSPSLFSFWPILGISAKIYRYFANIWPIPKYPISRVADTDEAETDIQFAGNGLGLCRLCGGRLGGWEL